MKTIRTIASRLARVTVLVTIAVGSAAPGYLAAAQTDLCIPSIGGLAGTPSIDGVVGSFNQGIADDLGWNNAVRVNLSADLGMTRASSMQIGRTATDLYLSFSVGIPTPGVDNTIALVFSTDGNPAHDWRIHITPFDNGTVSVNGNNFSPFSITYWRDSTMWNTGGAALQLPLLNGRIKYSRSGGGGNNAGYWEIEIQIPIETNVANAGANTKIYFPSSGKFGFYANVISTSFIFGNSFFQDPWPQNALITAPGVDKNLTANTPGPNAWGNVSFNTRPECKGVSLALGNIGVKDPNNLSNIISNIRAYNQVTENQVAQCVALAD